jgi:DNA-binding NarL/FixJ family response regulator
VTVGQVATTGPLDGSARRQRSVVLADDRVLIRVGISRLLEDECAILGRASTAQDLLSLLRTRKPDVVILCARLPGLPLPALARRLRYAAEGVLVILLIEREEIHLRAAGWTEGLVLVPSTSPPETLTHVVVNGFVSTPYLARPGVSHLLTGRQFEVLRLAGDALSNKEIGTLLRIRPGTVKRHLADAYRKLGARSRLDAVNRAMALGLLARGNSFSNDV